ncbi:hypothetical protein [Roseibacillus persicicus]|uniref:hypothetical protein n=1 Tax=Roseibacillus persicicus TaxID=454148 RepID=UPI00281057A0|nr:hypothetical protein [Roseibacillus persicicus]MDQ8189599.1 hypothetical protein [Roseibacillus persicicus]
MKRPTPLLACTAVLLLVLGLWFWSLRRATGIPSGQETAFTKSSQKDSASKDRARSLRGARKSTAPRETNPPQHVASQLQRGANQRLLWNDVEKLHREVVAGSLSPERVFSVRGGSPVGPLTLDEHSLSAVEGRLDVEALERFLDSSDEILVLPLNAEMEVLVRVSSILSRGPLTRTLTGSVVDNPYGDVLLVIHDGAVSGSVAFLDQNIHYQFAMAGNGDVAIRHLDPESYHAPCGNPNALPTKASLETPVAQGSEKLISPPPGAHVIDGVVGYGVEAREAQGGIAAIEALILASVDRTNLAFANSNAGSVYFALLATAEDPDYNFPGLYTGNMGSSDELGDLEVHGDGVLDTISQLALDLGADQQTMVVKQADGSAGIAYRPGHSMIAARDYMTSTRLVFPHELGHNIGCKHSWGDSLSDLESGHNYGWRFKPPSSEGVRTIMAYDWNWGRGAVIPYFANPDVFYRGARTGAYDGSIVTTQSTGDYRYAHGGYIGNAGTGFDGSRATLGARNGPYVTETAFLLGNRDRREPLVVLEPSGSDQWERGSTETIYWRGGGHSDNVNIDLLRGDVFIAEIARNVPAYQRFFSWTIPATPTGNDYSIRVTLAGEMSRSSAPFQIYSLADDDDGDGLANTLESNTGIFVSINDTGTNPDDADSDDDGYSDALEVAAGTDPNRGDYYPSNHGFILLEDFESTLFPLNGSARNIRSWSTPDNPNGLTVEPDPDLSGNRVGVINGQGSAIDVFLNLPNMIGADAEATLYFELRLGGINNTTIGLTDVASPYVWSNYEAHLQLKEATYVNHAGVELVAGDAFPAEHWVRVWLQVNNANDTFKVHVQNFATPTEPSPPRVQLVSGEISEFNFRNGTLDPLQSFGIRTSSALQSGERIHLDNLYLHPTEPSHRNPTHLEPPGFLLLENFEGEEFTLGASVHHERSWNAEDAPASLTVVKDPDQSANRVAAVNGVSETAESFLRMPLAISDRSSGTLFFEIRPDRGGLLSLGLSDRPSPSQRDDFQAEIRINQFLFAWDWAEDLNTFFKPIEDQWLKVWLVVRNDAKAFELHVQEPGASSPQQLSASEFRNLFPFRDTSGNFLRTLFIQPDATLGLGEVYYLDNLYLDPHAINLDDPTRIPILPKVDSISFSTTGIEVAVSGLLDNQSYLLERAASLAGPWTTIEEGFVPTMDTHLFQDEEPAESRGFYRFQVEFLP